MRAGIMVDDWKVGLFKKRLKEAGFEYELHRGLTENTRNIIVETDDPNKLAKVVSKTNLEACK